MLWLPIWISVIIKGVTAPEKAEEGIEAKDILSSIFRQILELSIQPPQETQSELEDIIPSRFRRLDFRIVPIPCRTQFSEGHAAKS